MVGIGERATTVIVKIGQAIRGGEVVGRHTPSIAWIGVQNRNICSGFLELGEEASPPTPLRSTAYTELVGSQIMLRRRERGAEGDPPGRPYSSNMFLVTYSAPPRSRVACLKLTFAGGNSGCFPSSKSSIVNNCTRGNFRPQPGDS